MRLAVLSAWWPYPPTNGAKLRAWHLLQQLARRHEIALLAFAEPGEATPEALGRLRDLCSDVKVVGGNPHKPSERLSFRGYFGTMPRSYAQTYNPRMAGYAVEAAVKSDAVVAFTIGAALYLQGLHRVPRVFEEAEASLIRDGVQPPSSALERWRRGMTWRKYARFTRQLVEGSSRATVVSEPERQVLAEVGCDPSRIAVIPNGVADTFLGVSATPQPDTLIYPGSPTYEPNLDAAQWFAADILPRVRAARGAGVTFTVTGSHDGVAIEPLTRAGVTVTGLVPDVTPLIAGSAICVVPLRQGGGTRLKILEAMALGTPVVSTSKGAEGLDVQPGAHLLIADDAETFARQIGTLLADPARARALAASARQLIAERYTWSRIGQQFEEVLAQAIEVERERLHEGRGAARS